MLVIYGGSGSGKSEYGEKRLVEMAKDHRFYLATMEVYGQEGRNRVERHRKLRAGKGFCTIEQTRNIQEVVAKIQETGCNSKEASCLLECLSNLVANEMFTGGLSQVDQVVEKVCREIDRLDDSVKNLVIVTNNIFEDGIVYPKETMNYLKALAKVNAYLMSRASEAIEVVVGIPVWLKKEEGHA